MRLNYSLVYERESGDMGRHPEILGHSPETFQVSRYEIHVVD